METQTEKRTASGGLSCELDLGNTVKHRETTFEGKGNLPNHQVIFSLSNAITGPNLILMPLLFMQTGIVASVILGVFFGYISYKTCYLTIMHVKPNEPEFLYTISRTIGKFWMWVYLIIVILDLWLVCVIFSVSLVDTLFPGIYSIIYSHEIKMDPTSMPDASIINFHEFSAQWVSVAVAILLLICVSFKDVTKIVKLSSHGELGIIIAAIFLIYLGIKSIAQGKIDLTFDRDETQASTPLFSYNGLWTLIGFYSAAYLLHFMAVPILRTGAEPAKKRTNLYLAYVATGLIYLITGVFGALGIYWRIPPSDGSPSTIFGSYFYQETDVFVLSIITQVAVAFQLITVLPVINYITKNQIFSYIWRKEDGQTVPDWAFHGYNVIFVIVMLVCMIYNVSPTTLMGYVGTFGGFIIVYLVPILIHLKSQKIFLGRTDEKAKAKESFFQQERQMSIVEQVHQEEAHISPIQLNIFYIGIILLGVVLVVVNIALAANAPFTQ